MGWAVHGVLCNTALSVVVMTLVNAISKHFSRVNSFAWQVLYSKGPVGYDVVGKSICLTKKWHEYLSNTDLETCHFEICYFSFFLFAFLKDSPLVYPCYSLYGLYQVYATMPGWLLCNFSSKRIKILIICMYWNYLALSCPFSLSLPPSLHLLTGSQRSHISLKLPSCAEYDLELLNPLASTYWVLKLQAYANMLGFMQCWGLNPRLSCMLGKDSTSWATFLVHYEVLENWEAHWWNCNLIVWQIPCLKCL